MGPVQSSVGSAEEQRRRRGKEWNRDKRVSLCDSGCPAGHHSHGCTASAMLPACCRRVDGMEAHSALWRRDLGQHAHERPHQVKDCGMTWLMVSVLSIVPFHPRLPLSRSLEASRSQQLHSHRTACARTWSSNQYGEYAVAHDAYPANSQLILACSTVHS